MTETFDPVRKRQFWLDFALPFETEFVPDRIPEQGQPLYVSVLTNSLVTGFLLGLADRVLPTLEAVVDWMDSRPEPQVGLFGGPRDFWHDDWYAAYAWQRTLGLAKWLSGRDMAEWHWGRALLLEYECWKQAAPAQVAEDGFLRRQRLGEHLVLALAAGEPDIGLYFYSAAGGSEMRELEPLQMLGIDGCLRMVGAEPLEKDFDRVARQLLGEALWPNYLSEGRYCVPALWLKFLFHDSGAVSTPAKALARAYDFMPGVQRPDFIDW